MFAPERLNSWFPGGDMENTRGCIVLQGKCQEINYF